jgi:AraC family transcriptional regulator
MTSGDTEPDHFGQAPASHECVPTGSPIALPAVGERHRKPESTHAPPHEFAESALVDNSLPARRLRCSCDLGWRSLLARYYSDPAEAEEFTTTPTSDLLLVVVTSGRYVIESRHGRSWARDEYHPGALGATAPGRTSTLRWRSMSSQPQESLHLFLAARLIEETARELEGSGSPMRKMPNELLLRDPLVEGFAHAILRAVEQKATALYADSLAQALVVHLLYGTGAGGGQPSGAGPLRAGGLGATVLRQVTDYMQDHLREDVTLDALAAEVHISKYHLLRQFSETTGLTPHRYLTELRISRAATLLATTDRGILHIAQACGYRSPSRFAAAFRRVYGTTPTHFRQHMSD